MPRDENEHGGISKIILTASGGPFRTREPATLADVTPERPASIRTG
jgi:1-deoxy-D-xylulose-5-phosphate reductoisomerase